MKERGPYSRDGLMGIEPGARIVHTERDDDCGLCPLALVCLAGQLDALRCSVCHTNFVIVRDPKATYATHRDTEDQVFVLRCSWRRFNRAAYGLVAGCSLKRTCNFRSRNAL